MSCKKGSENGKGVELWPEFGELETQQRKDLSVRDREREREARAMVGKK